MAQTLSPFRVLGLPEGASPGDVSTAYRRLAKLFHPDVNRSEVAAEMMRLINMARDACLDAPAFPAPIPPRDPYPGYAPPRRRHREWRAEDLPPSWSYVGDPCAFRMPFGKWRGVTLGWLMVNQPGYIKWTATSFDPDKESALLGLIDEMVDHALNGFRCGFRPEED